MMDHSPRAVFGKLAIGPAAALVWFFGLLGPLKAQEFTPQQITFFEQKIRPILVENCHKCHGNDEKAKAHLHLTSRQTILEGGESGPAIVPGNAEQSLLIKAVRYKDEHLQMPPKKELAKRQVEDLEAWVKMGAPWPAPAPGQEAPKVAKAEKKHVTEEDRKFWSFQPVRRPALPNVANSAWGSNAIDRFILAKLEEKGLAPNGAADRRQLIRRLYFDLLGMPPSLAEIDAFVADESPDAWDRLVDRVLASPRYGERWGRHWLDLVRYADSNGYEFDSDKPYAWRYRDYVIAALNKDKSYDRFVAEHIAGDELPDATRESIVATGFYRVGQWDQEPDDRRVAEYDLLDDMISTAGTAFMGLTIGCARCHDHMFDPIPQKDYYQLLAFFRNVRYYEGAKLSMDSDSYTPLAAPGEVQEWKRKLEEQLRPMQKEMQELERGKENADRRKALQEKIDKVKSEPPPFEWALSAREHGGKPMKTHVLIRGNAGTPGAEVAPAFFEVLGGKAIQPPKDLTPAGTTGLRTQVANWLASPDHPLTSRVMVNRLWQFHFGQGIVSTVNDFGKAGVAPTHPELLDWLADEFVKGGWSIKAMHRLMLTSSAYRMSSLSDNAKAMTLDPGNTLVWRQRLRRLEAEALRDTVLATSGEIQYSMGGKGMYPLLSKEVIAGGSRPGNGWAISPESQRARRSVYIYIKRTLSDPMLEGFDYSNTTQPVGERSVTTVAPQALLLLNSDFIHQQAGAMATRLMKISGGTGDRNRLIEEGYRLALGRGPTEAERKLAARALDQQFADAGATRRIITMRPGVPGALSDGYHGALPADQFQIGPKAAWSYYKGVWGGGYEGILLTEPGKGPFGLYEGAKVTDGVIEGKLMLHRASESASLIFRAVARDGRDFKGYELLLDPKLQKVSLNRHDGKITELVTAPMKLPEQAWVNVKIELAGSSIRAFVGDGREAALKVVDPSPIAFGQAENPRLGLRTAGSGLSAGDLSFSSGVSGGSGGSKIHLEQDQPEDWRAVKNFCLLLLNLNEFTYVD